MSPQSRKLGIIIVTVSVFLDFLGYAIILPLLPFFAEKFGAGGFAIGLLFTSYALAQFVFITIWGRISDHIGRRPVIIISLIGTTVYLAAFAFVPSIAALILLRLLGGIFGSSTAVAQAYMADVLPPQERIRGMGYIGAAFGAGFIIGPAIGSFFSGIHILLPFLAASGVTFIAAAGAYFFLPESLTGAVRAGQSYEKRRGLIAVLGDWRISLMIFLYFLGIFSFSNMETIFAIFSEYKFVLTPKDIGYFFAYVGALAAFIQIFVTPRLSRFSSDLRTAVLGGLFLTLGYFAMVGSHNLLQYNGALTILALGIGLSQPTLMSILSKLSGAGEEGFVLGLSQSAGRIAQIFGSLWAGYAYQYIGPAFPLVTAGLAMSLGFIIMVKLVYHKLFSNL